MWTKTISTLAFLALFQAAVAEAQPPANERAAFARLKGLKGSWTITDTRVPEAYRAVTIRSAAGDVLTLDEGGQLTVFHLDNGKLVLTHFCGAGTQPRMRVQKIDDRRIEFRMYDITNLSTPGADHTNGLDVVFLSEDHVELSYRSAKDGRETIQTVPLVRKKS